MSKEEKTVHTLCSVFDQHWPITMDWLAVNRSTTRMQSIQQFHTVCCRVNSAAAAVDASSPHLSVSPALFFLSSSSSFSLPFTARNRRRKNKKKKDNKMMFKRSSQTAVCALVPQQSMNSLFPVIDAAWQLHPNLPASIPHVDPPTITTRYRLVLLSSKRWVRTKKTHTHTSEGARLLPTSRFPVATGGGYERSAASHSPVGIADRLPRHESNLCFFDSPVSTCE